MSTVNQLTGGLFQGPDGTALVNGYLTLELNQDAQVNGSTEICSRNIIKILLNSSGSVVASQSVWPNDVLTPCGTFYIVKGYTSTGQLAWGPSLQQVTSTPSPFNVGTWIPNNINPSPCCSGSGDGGGGGAITGAGTDGFLTIWTGTTSIGNSPADYNVTNADEFTFPDPVIIQGSTEAWTIDPDAVSDLTNVGSINIGSDTGSINVQSTLESISIQAGTGSGTAGTVTVEGDTGLSLTTVTGDVDIEANAGRVNIDADTTLNLSGELINLAATGLLNLSAFPFAPQLFAVTTSPYSIGSANFEITDFYNATSGAITAHLPAASSAGAMFFQKKIDSSGNAVTITAGSGDNIQGASTYVLSTQYASVILIADGSHTWYVFGVSSGGGSLTPVQSDTNAGTITGSIPGSVFTLPSTPMAGTLNLSWNGQILVPTLGYTISGAVVTVVNALSSGDVLNANYFI